MHKAGIGLLAGTDVSLTGLVISGSAPREMELFVGSGLTTAAAQSGAL